MPVAAGKIACPTINVTGGWHANATVHCRQHQFRVGHHRGHTVCLALLATGDAETKQNPTMPSPLVIRASFPAVPPHNAKCAALGS
jgi:hypothetical protein